MIKNLGAALAGIDVWIDRVEETSVAMFRKAVWDLFCQILEETPQASGRAVANWYIGIDSARQYTSANVGDKPETMHTGVGKNHGLTYPHQKGDSEWITFAKEKQWPNIKRIKRSSRVYIYNAVHGDDDGGRSSEMYMDSLQDPGYWAIKLRSVNKPYETATETILKYSWKDFKQVGGSLVEFI